MRTAATDASPSFDERIFRETLGHFASGLTIVTGTDPSGPIGFTCQSFFSVSMNPPLVSFSVMKTSTTYPRIRQTGAFAVNVLSHRQEAVSGQFARRGTDKWAGVEWMPTAFGNPVLQDSLMWLDCSIWAEYDAGDHVIVVGEVRELSSNVSHRHEPLLFYKGRYRNLVEARELSHDGPSSASSAETP